MTYFTWGALGMVALLAILYILGDEEKPFHNDKLVRQWANRLIEHIDHRTINAAVKHFFNLVDQGLSPEHAFEVVVNG